MTRLTAALVRSDAFDSGSLLGATGTGRRRTRPRRGGLRFASAATLVSVLLAATTTITTGCGPELRPAVTLNLVQQKASPADAAVYIDEEYVGPLSVVAGRGVRLPAGVHRITIEKSGYFPWDREVTADREPIKLDVQLEPIPE